MNVSLGLFLQKNFKEVTMKEIVEKTGLSKGAFYHYFESKEQLFEQIISYFFEGIINFDFTVLEGKPFYEFYNEILERITSYSPPADGLTTANAEAFLEPNFYILIFDAYKMLPEFRKRIEAYHVYEMESWIASIGNARKNGEINSAMSDKQIAQCFIFTGDGMYLNTIMEKGMQSMRMELKDLWDSLYKSLRT